MINTDSDRHLDSVVIGEQVRGTSLRGSEENEQRFGHDTGNAGHTVSLCF